MLQLSAKSMRQRVLISILIAVASGTFCWFLLARLKQDAADFRWAIHAAQRMVQRQNPYDTPLEQYPLTAAVLALPFVKVPGAIAAGIFFGISSGLLAFGVTKHGYGRLLIFLAYPYWAAVLTAQWSPLIAASAFFWWLLPAAMAKPQIGLPVFLSYLSKRGAAACAVVLGLTLLWMPRWPVLWIKQMGYYEHFVPVLVSPGFLVLLALLRYRDREARLLVLTALVPQRWFFDAFVLWLIPKTRREILSTVALSWGAGIWRWYHIPKSFAEVGRWDVIFIYLPMLAVVLWPKRVVEHAGWGGSI
jgi:hypothetical protein